MDVMARKGAQQQWNANPCGAVDGDEGTAEFFSKVESERYAIQDWMLDYFDFKSFSKKNVLEIGVGLGTDMLQFARQGATCFGADITDHHIKLAKQNLENNGYEYHIKKCDATALDYKDQQIDCVYSFGVLHHLPEMNLAIDEIHRVLKNKGELQMALYYRYSAFHLFFKLFGQGLKEGKLFSLGYRGLMSTVEKGADGKAIKPYVTTYTKSQLKNILAGRFDIKDLSVKQLYPDHFYYRKLGLVLIKVFPFLKKRMGWYVVLRAVKKGSA